MYNCVNCPLVKFLSILVCCIVLKSQIFAQTGDITVSSVHDTVRRYQGMNPVMSYYYYDFDIYYPHNIILSQSEQMIDGSLSTLQLRTELALSYPITFNSNPGEVSNHFMLPYYNQYLENSKINPITYVLGLAQTAAVGYMAYRHIKKYGFWK